MAKLHHVNLGVLPDGVTDEEGWLTDVLGYHRLDLPPDLKGRARWFASADGVEVHLSADPEHRPAAAAHVALVVDDLDDLGHRLDDRSVEYTRSTNRDLGVIICRDPAGNRWELRAG
jgi:hypothetical protein